MPCNNLLNIIYERDILFLYMQEYIWKIIDIPLKPSINEIIQSMYTLFRIRLDEISFIPLVTSNIGYIIVIMNLDIPI